MKKPIVVYQAFYPWRNCLYQKNRAIALKTDLERLSGEEGLVLKVNDREIDCGFWNSKEPFCFARFFEWECVDGYGLGFIDIEELANDIAYFLVICGAENYLLKNMPVESNELIPNVRRNMEEYPAEPGSKLSLPLSKEQFSRLECFVKEAS